MMKNRKFPMLGMMNQRGSVMVESAFGMFIIVLMMLTMSWFFEVMDFGIQEEIEAGIDLRTNMIASNYDCYKDVYVDRIRSKNETFNLSKFIGVENSRYDIEYQKIAWTGGCPGWRRSRFEPNSEYRRFKGPDGSYRGSW